MESGNTMSEVETAYLDSRTSRWLDGVGVGGTVLVALLATLWALADLWAMGWSPSGAIGVALITLLFTVMGYRHRTTWHARKFERRRQRVTLGDETGPA